MNFESMKLRYYILLFFLLQFCITVMSYMLFGKFEVILRKFDVSQIAVILLVVAVANFCVTLIGFTLLSIFLDIILVYIAEYKDGYKKILKLLLLVSLIQILKIILEYLFSININIHSFDQIIFDIFFKIIELILLSVLAYSNFEKYVANILVISLFILQIISYIGMHFILG
ncbi:hypothetical protein [Ligilactobacillus faecis]|uniref:hypothetical protein n=1 Tax=Ligilactobacillus faecis TaxID=762833 RepID=UPI0024698102|nr:hypothetical protein [Ligilactobacillus faecis]WGN90318.1 hypothetical protein QFX10_04440 [Ligilactobacillus faecis]